MATLFLILFVLGLFHFIYESTIAPSLRLILRYDLFKLRDDLRLIKADNKDVSDNVFDLLDSSINTTIKRLPYYSISKIIDAKQEYKSNRSLQKTVNRKKRTLEKCNIKEIKTINSRLLKLTVFSLIVNSGGWLYIVIPFLLIVTAYVIISDSLKSIKKYVAKETSKITYASNSDLQTFHYSI